jgi:Flp pilus assembly protein TadD
MTLIKVFGFALALYLAIDSFGATPDPKHYVGSETCALCHKDIAATQAKTAMAMTWQGMVTSLLPATYHAQIAEQPDPALVTQVGRLNDRFEYSVAMPERPKVTLPIEVIMGGKRHVLGFLSRIQQLDGIPLQRPALIQTRYAWSDADNKLVLAPGCSPERPRSYQTAFGITLSPGYEARCLECHGRPATLGAGTQGGVRCETCHGPGSQHLQAVGKGIPGQGIVNPRRLSSDEGVEICAQCHVGLTKFSDPTPDDLLIANQVVALKSSECFIQSGKRMSCTTCHNPHKDAEDADELSIRACLSCHSMAAKPHAAICPVNASGACVGCHMPSKKLGSFHLVDHQIRVHPEQGVQSRKSDEGLRSEIRPVREFLRIIVAKNREQAEEAGQRLRQGEAFSRVARELSSATGLTGGYMGAKLLSELDPALASTASTLAYGQTSGIIEAGERWIILHRMPRDFKWEADQRQREAEVLRLGGDPAGALEKCQQALIAYPHFLRALTFMGMTFGKSGNPQRGIDVLRVATALYPNDAGAEFDLALILDELGHRTEAMEAYRRAVALDPDLVSAYAYLGRTLYSNEDLQGAINVFRQGLQVDPLSAELYYGLGLALTRHGNVSGAKRAIALASQIDPDVANGKKNPH